MSRNLIEMTKLKVPIICIIIGEGASGVFSISIGDKVLMMENSGILLFLQRIISTILWRSWEFKEKSCFLIKTYFR